MFLLFVSSSLCAAGIECVGVPHQSLHAFDAIILFSISFEAALQEILSLGAALWVKLVKMNGRLDDDGWYTPDLEHPIRLIDSRL